ncbi:MAG TPA: Asp-tRNA(Asn)/Glu-tRNA(Gln) amidotransferase subunit GatB, partial [Thermoanaerobaculia bacterium]|nr:Asp-tRNA(Asn)/Glu-tRNA(Gln) amidotransferase subunit GatB [Thermoanaerobaculia bacterium]
MWETVIGLEVHARLETRSKLFCGCSTEYGNAPNSQVCPVCLGYPGALPVLNRKAVELAIRIGLATNCTIHVHSVFARKNYFYPDLPKGYQISQFDRPIATGGHIDIHTSTGPGRVRIQRIHIEEDAGKSLHQTPYADVPDDVSLVDLNRSGTGLVEIVTEPDVRSAEEANAYLTRLRQVLMYTGVCDGNMEEGSLRCDANVSVHKPGEPLGTRAEVKNLNSFRFLSRAIEFEADRQIALLEGGQRVVQETRLFDPGAGETRSMRSKEEAHDYRYFPEPDLGEMRFEKEWVEAIRADLPELPAPKSHRYQTELHIPAGDAETLVATRELAGYFEETVQQVSNPRTAANWVKNEVIRVLNERKISIGEYLVTPVALGQLIGMIESGAINGKTAKEVFDEMSASGKSPESIVREKGLGQISDPAAIREQIERVIAASPGQVAQYRAGKASLFGFF